MDVKAFLVPRLAQDRRILGLLGGPGRFVYGAQGAMAVLPCIRYRETEHRDFQFSIEGAWGTESTFTFDIGDEAGTSGLREALHAAMTEAGFFRRSARDVAATGYVLHRVSYTRLFSDREIA